MGRGADWSTRCRIFCAVTPHSNRVSSNPSLCCRETEFCGQRQRRRNSPLNPKHPLQRQEACTQPANTRSFANSQEISVSGGLRGGPERTQTACQARSPIEPVSMPATKLQVLPIWHWKPTFRQ